MNRLKITYLTRWWRGKGAPLALWGILFLSCRMDSTTETDPSSIDFPSGENEPSTGEPHPFPLPDISLIRTGGVLKGPPPGLVDVIGLSGAVAGPGLVIIENEENKTTATATAAGSFATKVELKTELVINIRYQDSQSVAVTIPENGITNSLPPKPIPNIAPITASANGTIIIRGQTEADGGTIIIAANFNSGDTATTTSLTDSTFQLEITAQSGDSIQVYDDSVPLGPSWELIVP